ncbi:MAG: quinoprotein dehydrogenase-associated putative ABC transporter substrate-binding protein [Gammaproteobacteria bacterium]|nr:quinoprotein dehydrogenase-associated putative ABC transporter substrate-binding protein [Gammaproteobacteria bacterium]MBV8307815.1 quinoprotein dehydrogenase-associated putative ABC transporter substrate-binding protein [Gammaproteobacteria bacterium]MBV8404322.1 quinoprotein dehydrogenase-associated putative ABC transporter substrate-binding protein [Gammaproteobacteria bacterium]
MKYLVPALLALQLAAPAHALVVCADPNNLPFSNRAGEGFENRLVTLLARQLHTDVQYVWWAQRRGFARHTLTSQGCDLWAGVASGTKGLRASQPYYRSSYVFVTRRARALAHLSLDDPRLRTLIIGVQLVGYEAMNTPPAQALAARGITGNVRGFSIFGDYSAPNPPARIIAAVVSGEVDVALVWGPVAGYFARRSSVPLRLEWIPEVEDWPMAYDIALGVRRDEDDLRARLDAALTTEQPQIEGLLREYAIPHANPGSARAAPR